MVVKVGLFLVISLFVAVITKLYLQLQSLRADVQHSDF